MAARTRPIFKYSMTQVTYVHQSVTLPCVSVCLSVCNALTSESFDPEGLLVVCSYIFGISRPSSHVKVIGSRSRSQEQKSVYCLKAVCLRLKGNLAYKIQINNKIS